MKKRKLNESVQNLNGLTEEEEYDLLTKEITEEKARSANADLSKKVNGVNATFYESIERYDGEKFKKRYADLISESKAFYSPLYILEDTNLRNEEKVLFFLISSMSVINGHCTETNTLFASKMGVSVSSVKRYLSTLINNNLVKSELSVTRNGISRKLHIQFASMAIKYYDYK